MVCSIVKGGSMGRAVSYRLGYQVISSLTGTALLTGKLVVYDLESIVCN
jgi:hypothetical protein